MKYLLILLAITANTIFTDKKIPHCVSDGGTTYVFTSPISETTTGMRDIVIECIKGKLDKEKGEYNEW